MIVQLADCTQRRVSRGKPTIIDVAKAAGVSVSTVSRVINGEAHVRPARIEAVQRAIASLGFTPDPAARSLPGSRSFIIGAIFEKLSPFYLAHLQLGAMEACRAAGYLLVVEQLDLVRDPDLTAFARTLATARFDGVIVAPPVADHPKIIDLLSARGIRMARIAPGNEVPGTCHIECDDEGGAAALAKHLLELGHVRFGMIAGPPGNVASVRRQSGFQSALREHGLDPSCVETVVGDFTFESGMQACEALLEKGSFTAIVAANDDMAAGVLAVLHRRGIVVPDQMSVCGFDDSPTAQLVWPPLTTVRQPIMEMSAAAANFLIRRDTEGHEIGVFPTELVVRNSTGPAAAPKGA
ncbi:LacI family DNA-binding transcriptional regulator [Phenylobacterium sp.]|uniref:LacI family DNA-binding transcriptional regulator n=1 Tax=Phenylobacterium sp. TaxID=1871053 RepID=UPI003D294F7A